MSRDVQMFVLCDHILNVPRMNDPLSKPVLSIEENESSELLPGTYYVGYTYVTMHNVETKLSPIEKILIGTQQDIIIDIEEAIIPEEVLTYNLYVTYTPEDLVSTDLTEEQFKKEKELMKRLFYQDNFKEGLYDMGMFVVNEQIPPEINLTFRASYVDRVNACPRCYGKNYYYDIYFDSNGQAVTATKSQKLLQECLKILIDDRLGNQFHPEWGCDVDERVGTKNRGSIDLFRVELSVRSAIEHLQRLQTNNQLIYQNMFDEEIIDSIESIKVERDGLTGFSVKIEIVSTIGDVITYNVNL